MNIFFGGTFIKAEELKEANINYPIKLEYYKIINEDQMTIKKKAKYGVKVVKTEYKKEEINVEEEKIEYLSNDEQKIEEILNILKINEVTPVSVKDIIVDFSKSRVFI